MKKFICKMKNHDGVTIKVDVSAPNAIQAQHLANDRVYRERGAGWLCVGGETCTIKNGTQNKLESLIMPILSLWI